MVQIHGPINKTIQNKVSKTEIHAYFLRNKNKRGDDNDNEVETGGMEN